MIERRLAETAERVYRLQAERVERRRDSASLVGTEDECMRAGAHTMMVEIEYLQALEAHFIDSEVLLRSGAAGRSAA